MKRSLVVSLVFAIVIVAASSVDAAELFVTVFDDHLDNVCEIADCSLRDAVWVANNASPGPDIIYLPEGTFTLSLTTANTGDLTITEDLIIAGQGRDVTVIDGSPMGERVMDISAGVSCGVADLTITGGSGEGSSTVDRRGGGSTTKEVFLSLALCN